MIMSFPVMYSASFAQPISPTRRAPCKTSLMKYTSPPLSAYAPAIGLGPLGPYWHALRNEIGRHRCSQLRTCQRSQELVGRHDRHECVVHQRVLREDMTSALTCRLHLPRVCWRQWASELWQDILDTRINTICLHGATSRPTDRPTDRPIDRSTDRLTDWPTEE